MCLNDCLKRLFTIKKEAATTPDRILDAAERVFGQHGFARTSLRQITRQARVNLAAVNYHFGSKEELYRQVVVRHVRPLNEERAALLAQAEQLAGDQPVPLRAVLDTFLRPVLRRAADGATGGRAFLRLLARDLLDPPPFLQAVMAAEFAPLMKRYDEILRPTLPDVPPAELFWRMQFTVGAMLFVAAHQHDLVPPPEGHGAGGDWDGCIRRLIDFCTAGLGASVPPGAA